MALIGLRQAIANLEELSRHTELLKTLTPGTEAYHHAVREYEKRVTGRDPVVRFSVPMPHASVEHAKEFAEFLRSMPNVGNAEYGFGVPIEAHNKDSKLGLGITGHFVAGTTTPLQSNHVIRAYMDLWWGSVQQREKEAREHEEGA